MGKELKKTDLVAAHDEIDKIVGIVPPLKETLKQDKYEKDLYTTIVNDLELSTAEIKEFSKKTQEVIKALKEKFAKADDEDEDVDEVDEDDEQGVEVEEEEEEEEDEEDEAPAPVVKKGKTPVVVIEEDEDEELSLIDQVLACRKRGDYIELINTSPEFKKDKKRLLAISSVFSLKKEMLAVVSPAKKAPVVVDDDDDEEEAEEIKHVKKTAKVKVEKVKKEKKVTSAEYNRVDALCDALKLKTKPKTLLEWAKAADTILIEKGGTVLPNTRENKFTARYILKVSKHFDLGTLPSKE